MLAINNSPVHGTAIAVHGRGFLFVGGSGSGKSGLALQMMALGADLIADDQVLLVQSGSHVEISAPEPLKSKVEARFLGIIETTSVRSAPLVWVVDLAQDAPTRLPQLQYCEVLGVRFGLINGRNVPNLASTLTILGRGGRLT
ncbi:serine kinase [Amylibacter sp. IMCC11727]|uniref:HPr kinase/phosphorylase n=1 Tax=Amylibacter sp. IMCC11727 TaxID=3039851 RepID=UPI00244E5A82|nr:serine kinase [Amylibacter sp. IMCC11727]WGI21442.1 serine kinase [Amylibacter sp. IMCC11727]